MSVTSVVNDTLGRDSFVNAQKPVPPTISGYSVSGIDDTALDPAGGQTVLINGTGFQRGATITLDGSAIAVVTWVSANQLSFTSSAKSAGTYTIYVVNSDGGTAIYVPGLIYSNLPSWTTGAGSLGSYYETKAISNTVVASGDAPITYSLASGSLPTGATLSSGGVITGTAPADSGSTTYSFTIEALDAQLQSSTRSFSLTINTDVVTWSNPSNGATINLDGSAYSNALSATSAAGYNVSYTANTLPTGLTLSSGTISGTPTVDGSTTTLLTATAATSGRSATNTITWVVSLGDSYWKYVTTLLSSTIPSTLPFNDDASTNNFNVTIFGDTKPSNWGPYQGGYYSNYFDGSGDYLTVPNNAAFNFGTSNFTVECWVYWISGDFCVFGGTSGGATDLVYYSNSFRFGRYNTAWDTTLSYTLTAGQWYHIAFIKESGTAKVYVNGTLAGSASNGISYDTQGGTMNINASGDGSRQGNVYFSNHRVVKGTAVYTANFTPPTEPLTAIANTSLLTCQSNRFIDNSTNNFTITRNGDTLISGFAPFVPSSSYSSYGSMYVDGTGDYLSVPDNTALRLSSTDFTIEFWGYQTTTSNGTTGYFSKGNDYALDNDANRFVLRVSGGNTFVLGGNLDQNIWTHLALVRNGGTITLYKNGVSVGSASSPTISDSSSALLIGWCSVGSGALFTGYISNFRVVKGTAVYTGAFTPGTTPLTAIANTGLLTCQTNQPVNNNVFVDESTNNFLVTRNGNTTQGTFSPYGENWSNYFDGNGDYLSANATTLPVGSSNYTIECWFYGNTGSKQTIVFWGTGNSNQAMALTVNANGSVFHWWFANDLTTTGVNVLDNNWHHLVATFNGTTRKIYVDGVQRASDTPTGKNTSGTSVTIGYQPNIGGETNYLTGYISNLRVVSGLVYDVSSSSLTVPTTPLTAIANTQLLTCQSNRINDSSANNFTITKNGDVSIQKFGPFAGVTLPTPYYSAYFRPSASDSLVTPSSAVFGMGTGDWTVEGWYYTGSSSGDFAVAWHIGTINASDGMAGSVASNFVKFRSNGQTDISAAVSISNTWRHIAWVKSSNVVTVYVNGTSVVTGTYTNSIATGVCTVVYNSSSFRFDGYVSNFRIVKGTAVYTSTFTPPTSPLTAIANTSLLTCQSATFIDNSSNNFTLTVNGNSQPTTFNPFTLSYSTQQSYTPSVFGGSMYFDGSGDYLTVPANSAFNLSTGNWTIEFWFYTTVSKLATIVSQGESSWRIHQDGTTIKYTAQGADRITGSIAVSLNVWNHCALVSNNGTTTLYINGASAGTTATAPSNDNSSTIYVGINPANAGWAWGGYLSSLRVVKGQALYTSQFVPPQAPITAVKNTTILLNGTTGGIIDSSEITTFETVGDAKLNSAITKFSGKVSMYFDGTGDYLKHPSNQTVSFGTGDFTIEAWIYWNSLGSESAIMWANGVGWTFYIYPANKLQWGTTSPQSAANLLTGSTTLATGQWYHIAVTKTSGTVRMFVNGTLDGSVADSNNYSAAGSLEIGRSHSGNSFNGYMSDVRITKGIARYTATFTAPSSSFQTK